uniref:E3 ubiquitin-protein ligase listerin n=1 Tax=Plectus sambesii TaxID=2011161 RepID=A0A914WB10_9BILA
MSKQQPRKKGNLQPASSTRAAALLTSNSGGLGGVPSTIGFVGFDGLTGSGGGGSLPEEFGPDLDAELRIVFRKLSKKDAVTREKALKELIELLSAKDDAAVEAAALCWTRPYSKLSLDGGFKVRAGSHNVMSAFAARLGRSLGKMVKQIVPYLILGMSDPYREVAQAAESCFESAFREEKRLQAVRLCSSETMTICTELLSSTGALFNPQKYDTEETEEMRQTRLISSALLAIHRVVSDSTDTELTSLRDHLARSLWTDNKFWKTVCKHKSGAVRAATFRLLRTWIERFATDFETFVKSAATAIVAALEDSDLSVAKNAFDCWLLCLGNEEFWKNVNIEKAVIPKFLAILRSNSASTSAVIGPCLLPSFSAILARVEADKKEDFMRRWINSLIQGMTESPEKTPLSSAKPKNDAWIAAFVDCFKFCISNANGSRLLLDEMLENLLTVIRLALDKKGSSAQVVSNAVAWTVSRCSSSAAVPNFVISHFVEQLTEEVVKRGSDDGAAVEFVEHIVASGAESLGAALASQLFHHCLNSPSSVHSSTTMASIAASKRLNTPAFWQELQKLGWKSTDEVVLRLVDLVVAGQVDAVSVPAHVSTVLTFVSELCVDGVAEQTLRRLSQCDNVVVRKALLGEARKRLALKPIQNWIATADFKEFWLRCLQEAAVEQDADLWSTLMEYTSHFISSTRVAEQAVVEETLVALSTILTAWCQSMITERSADRCLTMIVQLVRVIFDSGHISSDSTSLEVIVRQIWILLLDSATHLSDSLAASLEEIVSKAVTVRKSDDLYSSLTRELTTRLDTEVFSVDRMQWFISCALRLSAHKEEKLNAFRLSAEAEKKLLAFIGRQYALMFWLGDSCPIPLTKPESCESAPLALRSFINRTVFSALLLMDCGGNCWWTASPNKSSPPIATSVIAVAALVRVLAAEDALDSHTSSLTSSLQPALELLRTDSAGRFALVKQLLRSALASPDAISLLSLSLLCELLDADERRDVERSLASEVRDAAVDVEKVALVGTALRVPMTGAVKNRQGTPLGKWTLIFQLAAAAYDNETALALFDVWLAEHQEEMQTHLLLCRDGSAVTDWSTLAFNCALIRFLRRIAEDVSTLNAAQRDFLCCSLVSWLQTCEQMVESGVAEGEEFSLFSCHVLSLFDSCARQAASDKAVTDFVQEWNEFFAESCANSILPWLFSRCDGSAKWDFVCDALCGAVTHLNKQALLSVKLPTLLDPEMEKNNYSASLQSLLLRAAPLLRNRHRSAQLASWSIITK